MGAPPVFAIAMKSLVDPALPRDLDWSICKPRDAARPAGFLRAHRLWHRTRRPAVLPQESVHPVEFGEHHVQVKAVDHEVDDVRILHARFLKTGAGIYRSAI